MLGTNASDQPQSKPAGETTSTQYMPTSPNQPGVPTRRSLVINGKRISFFELGDPNPLKPSLVLLHGLTATAETFLPLMESLGHAHHVISIDSPGTKFSEPAASDEASQGTI